MTLMMGELGRRYDYHPRMTWRMLGERRTASAPETVRIDRLVARG
jgi:hypothetical protein